MSMFFFATGEIISAAAGVSRGGKYLAIVETSMAGQGRVPGYFFDLTKSVVGEHGEITGNRMEVSKFKFSLLRVAYVTIVTITVSFLSQST